MCFVSSAPFFFFFFFFFYYVVTYYFAFLISNILYSIKSVARQHLIDLNVKKVLL